MIKRVSLALTYFLIAILTGARAEDGLIPLFKLEPDD